MSLIYAAIIDIRRTLCLSPEGEQENEAFYSGTPERGVPGEGWSRQKIATLREEGWVTDMEGRNVYKSAEEREGGRQKRDK